MKVDEISKKIGHLPHMSRAQAKAITALIRDNQAHNILELGFRHGVSTCYLAGALDELGGGSITTIDLETVRSEHPNLETLLDRVGLRQYVTFYYEPTSYTWRLMKMLEEDPSPRFDCCYIDGAHNWFVDGFAFFLVDRLLVPGGWLIFDDLEWTYATSPALKDTAKVKAMPVDERETPQIRKVYELLVKPHPSYGDFMDKDGWAYARKTPSPSRVNLQAVRKEIVYQNVGPCAAIVRLIRAIGRRFGG